MIKPKPKIAVIELGTTAVRILKGNQELILKEVFNSENFHTDDSTLHNVITATDSFGMVKQKFVDEVIETILDFVDWADDYKVYIFATQGYRSARNIDYIIDRVSTIGYKLDVLTPKKEAELGVYAFSIAKPKSINFISGNNYLFIDVGGGSTEISIVNDNDLVMTESLKLGTSLLREIFFSKYEENKDIDAAFQASDEFIDVQLQNYVKPTLILENFCVGFGKSIKYTSRKWSRKNTDGKQIKINFLQLTVKHFTQDIEHYINPRHILAEKDYDDYDIDESEIAEKLDSRLGLPVFIELMQVFKIKFIIASQVGVRHGYFLEKLFVEDE